MAAYKASLTAEETEALVRETAELKAYQEEEDSPEAVESIPLPPKRGYQQKNACEAADAENRGRGAGNPSAGLSHQRHRLSDPALRREKMVPDAPHSLSGDLLKSTLR